MVTKYDKPVIIGYKFKNSLVKFDENENIAVYTKTGRKRNHWQSSVRAKSRKWLKNKCETCSNTQNLTIDHIIPLRNAIIITKENCQTLCQNCHRNKNLLEREKTPKKIITKQKNKDIKLPETNIEIHFYTKDSQYCKYQLECSKCKYHGDLKTVKHNNMPRIETLLRKYQCLSCGNKGKAEIISWDIVTNEP